MATYFIFYRVYIDLYDDLLWTFSYSLVLSQTDAIVQLKVQLPNDLFVWAEKHE